MSAVTFAQKNDTTDFPETRVGLSDDVSALSLRQAFSQFPSGVAALAGYAGGVKEGLAASSFTVGVSLDPPLVAFAVQNTSRTWPRLRHAERIGVSILGESQTGVCTQLASKNGDRFEGQNLQVSEQGAVFFDDAALWLETSVYAELPAGDHHMVLLQVHGVSADTDAAEPLVFHRSAFRNLRTAEGNE
ncbi:flavin reductase family protein [Citricoccus sp. NR2]|uniref:flavin reductase family protein n=1 Tax=Citricoccus sp. NR2 TaxID=3004095 RepID=UPI0022DD57A6|nr:flavin reductase family protein [Citricoccus sp. NR2]WBL20353.1 flavin reductase family protein [Citricoccus sp. NR2]